MELPFILLAAILSLGNVQQLDSDSSGSFQFAVSSVEGTRVSFHRMDGPPGTMSYSCTGCTFLVYGRGVKGATGATEDGMTFRLQSAETELVLGCHARRCDISSKFSEGLTEVRNLIRNEVAVVPVTASISISVIE